MAIKFCKIVPLKLHIKNILSFSAQYQITLHLLYIYSYINSSIDLFTYQFIHLFIYLFINVFIFFRMLFCSQIFKQILLLLFFTFVHFCKFLHTPLDQLHLRSLMLISLISNMLYTKCIFPNSVTLMFSVRILELFHTLKYTI